MYVKVVSRKKEKEKEKEEWIISFKDEYIV